MSLFKSIRSHHFHSLLKLHNHSHHLRNIPSHSLLSPYSISTNFNQSFNLSSFSQRPFSLAAQFLQKIDTELKNSEKFQQKSKKTNKPLDILFKEAVGIIEKPEDDVTEGESDSEGENGELKRKLRKLEEEVRAMIEQRKKKLREKGEEGAEDEGNKSKARSLTEVYAKKEVSDGGKSREVDVLRMEDPGVYKELSDDMIMFVTLLYKEGYFNDSNFLSKNKFDISCFQNSYARDFVKFAAEQFGKDNQEIAKWLSGSDLKTVALFGCPSLAKRNVFSAKRLRSFFGIPENIVCDKCAIKDSCKFVNQNVWNGDTKTLNLVAVMRLITLYALESVPPQLVLPEELKASVRKLLKEVVKLSQTVL